MRRVPSLLFLPRAPLARLFTALLSALLLGGTAAAQTTSLTAPGVPYTQTFDTLASAGTSSVVPPGWALLESGTNANGSYTAGTGSGNAGDTYSFGAAGASERALGSLQSGALVPLFGAVFTNDTGVTITAITIAYTGEQWRLGTTARTDRLDFQYSVSATSLASGTWTDVDALDFTTLDTGAVGARDGNAAGTRALIGTTITGLDIPAGATFWIRWTDFNASGADDGLAVDDFSLTPNPSGPIQPGLAITDVTQAEGNAGTSVFTFTVSLASPAGPGGVTFDIATADNTATTASGDYVARALVGQAIAAGESTYTFAVDVIGDASPEPTETFFVNVTNVVGATVSDGQGVGTISNDDVLITQINQIQGTGTVSPLAGQTVTTRGIVTGVRTNAFFIQSQAADDDGDPASSEGLLVFTGSTVPAAVADGNVVLVTGTVTEFVSSTAAPGTPTVTEIVSPTVTLLAAAQSLPTPVSLSPSDVMTFTGPERYEGMLVTVPSLTVVAPTGGNISEANATSTSNGLFTAVITGTARPFREPGLAVYAPLPVGAPANIPRFDTNPERIAVDTDALVGGVALNVATGAVVTGVAGPLDSVAGTWTILNRAAGVMATAGLGLTTVPTPSAGEVTVGSLNFERFFDTVNAPGVSDVVLTAVALARRLSKASLTVREVLRSPDILATVEIENLEVLQALAARINDDTVNAGGVNPGYTAFLVEGNDVGGIDVGFLVKTMTTQVASVTQVGAADTYVDPNTGLDALLNDRPPLVLEAVVTPAGGAPFPITVVANHLRSLNGIDDPTPSGAGTAGGRVRAKRKAQAEWLAGWIQARQLAAPTERLLLVGDFNAFEFSDGYVDVIGTIAGTPAAADTVVLPTADLVTPDLINLVTWVPPTQRYSYVFEGSAQVLDHGLITQNLSRLVSRVTFSRSNVDQPESLRGDETTPARLSDHDGMVVGFAAGTPAVQVSVAGVTTSGTSVTVTLRLRNAGTGNLFDLAIGKVTARAVTGAGAIVLTSALPLPVAPVLGPGQAATTTLTFTVPAGVTRFALVESGTYANAAGRSLKFSGTQSVTR